MKCTQCNKELDLLGMFTTYQVCKKCCVKNHKDMLGRIKKNVNDDEIKKQTWSNK